MITMHAVITPMDLDSICIYAVSSQGCFTSSTAHSHQAGSVGTMSCGLGPSSHIDLMWRSNMSENWASAHGAMKQSHEHATHSPICIMVSC